MTTATRIVHTPSGPVPCCARHASKVISLMTFLGTHAHSTTAPDGLECTNCINESKEPQQIAQSD